MDLESDTKNKWDLCCSSVYKSEVVFFLPNIIFIYNINIQYGTNYFES